MGGDISIGRVGRIDGVRRGDRGKGGGGGVGGDVGVREEGVRIQDFLSGSGQQLLARTLLGLPPSRYCPLPLTVTIAVAVFRFVPRCCVSLGALLLCFVGCSWAVSVCL